MAEKTKTSSGVIAAIAALVLCIVFPRSTWGYIVFIVGGIWAYRVFFPTRRNSRLLTRLLEPRRPPQRRHWKPRLEQRRALRRLKCQSPVHRPPQLLQPLGSSQMTTLCHWPRRHLCRQLPCHRTQHLLLPPGDSWMTMLRFLSSQRNLQSQRTTRYLLRQLSLRPTQGPGAGYLREKTSSLAVAKSAGG